MSPLRTVEAGADLRALVRELATAGHDEQDVLAMYVDLDPANVASAPARTSAIAAALDAAGRNAPDARWQPLLRELEAAFAAAQFDVDGARGLLVYGTRDGDATLVRLPASVPSQVGFQHGVPVRPLVAALEQEQWLVLLCNRRTSRLLVGDRHALEELSWWQDLVEGQHDQGGWSQARYQRNIERQVHDHVRRTAQALLRLREEGTFGRLLVGAPQELRSLIEDELDDQTRRCLSGFVDVDVEHAATDEVERLVEERIVSCADERDDELLERLQSQLGTRSRAAAGLDDVLDAARAAAIDTLLVAEAARTPGFRCPNGDWPSAAAGSCPTHGLELEPVADIVEALVDAAITQDAHVCTIRQASPDSDDRRAAQERPQHGRLLQLGGVAALLRYDAPTL